MEPPTQSQLLRPISQCLSHPTSCKDLRGTAYHCTCLTSQRGRESKGIRLCLARRSPTTGAYSRCCEISSAVLPIIINQRTIVIPVVPSCAPADRRNSTRITRSITPTVMVFEDLCRGVTCCERGDGCEIADEGSFGDARGWWCPNFGQGTAICGEESGLKR